MKKMMVFSLGSAFFLIKLSGSAHALTAYQDVAEFGTIVETGKGGQKIANSQKYDTATFAFNGIKNPFIATDSTVPILSLSMPEGSNNFVDRLFIKVASDFIYMGNITSANNSIAFKGDTLALLNQGIQNGTLMFQLRYGEGGKSSFSGATFGGPTAPRASIHGTGCSGINCDSLRKADEEVLDEKKA